MNVRQTIARVVLCGLACGSMGVAPGTSESAEFACQPENAMAVRFEAVDVFVDSGTVPMAAYEIEFRANVAGTEAAGENGRALLVGVEGGVHKAFTKPPYYDPAALQGNRIIVAALSVDKELPTGNTRVARLHVQVPAKSMPDYACAIVVAGDTDAKEIKATATVRLADMGPSTAAAPAKADAPKAPLAPPPPAPAPGSPR